MSLQRWLHLQKIYRLMSNLCRSIRWGLLTCFCVGLIVACAGNPQTSVPSASPPACRMIQHAMGETCVPANPQRVVALSGFAVDTLFSLDMQPIGAVTNVSSQWADQMQEVAPLGMDEQVNLEKILALQPDLILASQWNAEPIYEQLSAIAPTVLDDAILGEWKKSFTLHAAALGKTQQAKQLMAQYQRRVEELRSQLGESIQQTKISLVRILPEGVALYLKNSFAGHVLDDVGFPRPPAQDKGVIGEEPFVVVVSKERIEDADGDIIFVWTFGATPEIAKTAQTALRQIQTDPLWLQLDAVQQGKVFEVKDYWHVASTPTQAMMILNDLSNYLGN
ncbi:iron-siderophore ABC transporter substrate-binding protein [filamentous cyanobacterium CCP2]|nr:iron-siderophore ABC transporter substrate-binding protein [filamentous cyanobacterium CCP2]